MSYLDGSIAVTTTGNYEDYEVREYRCGYKQALTDAVEIVRGMLWPGDDDTEHNKLIYIAIAAIRALEEK